MALRATHHPRKSRQVATIDPVRHDGVIFDLDGVVTDTAMVHAAAWKQLFDEYLAGRPDRAGEDHGPFTDADYRRYVDGKPRYEGVADFLGSRGVSLPRGEPTDAEATESICGLGNRKDSYFRERLEADGVTVFESTVALVRQLQRAGVRTAVFSASRNCRHVLERAALGDLFPVQVDGVVADELGIPGKPDPAMLLEAADRLDLDPARVVVVEDARAGVEAGRRGGFGLVIGVDRTGHPEALREGGADVVVTDLAEVGIVRTERPLLDVPDADEHWDLLAGMLESRHPAVFLDFDGTLSEIVADPDEATLVDGAATVLERLAGLCPLAVISGRDLEDLRRRVTVDSAWYAGSHGFELVGPDGEHHENDRAQSALPALRAATEDLEELLADVPGAQVERKRFATAVHYRNVADERHEEIRAATASAKEGHDNLRVTQGRRVTELRPDIAWDKGRALEWLQQHLDPGPTALPIFAGDDLTDEDALEAVHTTGLGIVVRSDEHGNRPTAAHVAVDSPDELCRLLDRIAAALEPEAEPGAS
jgi:alpha,alpha-trehalase